jgi:hypothetical protein
MTKKNNKQNEKNIKTYINITSNMCKNGAYAQFIGFNKIYCHLNSFQDKFICDEINNICEVDVQKLHAIDIIPNYLTNYNPVTLCVVKEDFNGTFPNYDSISDDIYNIRTSYNTITLNNNPFPLKKGICVYNKDILIVRNNELTFINQIDKLYKINVITTSSKTVPALLDENRMYSNDFLLIMETIEGVFQTAIKASHDVLILTPFGVNDDIPQEDIIIIYNHCIYKYGHYFKKIIFGIPIWYRDLCDLYDEMIIRPQLF